MNTPAMVPRLFDEFAPITKVDEEARKPLPPRADALPDHSLAAKLGAFIVAGAIAGIISGIITALVIHGIRP